MDRKGFSPIIVLLIVAVVLVAGGVWYYVAHQSSPSQISNPNAQVSTTTVSSTLNTGSIATASTTTPTSSAPAAVPLGWKLYQNQEYGFEIWYSPQLTVTPGVEVSGLIRIEIGDSIIIDAAKLNGQTWQNFFKEEKPYSTLAAADISNPILTQQFTDSGPTDMIQWEDYVGGNSQFYYDVSVMTKNTSQSNSPSYQQTLSDAKEAAATFQTITAQTNVSQPTSSPLQVSADWSTYKNLQYAFDISYPPGWSTSENPEGVTIQNYTSILNQPTTPITIDITDAKNDNPQSLSLANYIATKYAVLKTLFAKAISVQSTTIDGQPAIKYTWQGDYTGSGYAPAINTKTYTYYISRGTDVISITYSLPIDMTDASVVSVVSTLNFVPFNQAAYNQLIQQEDSSLAAPTNPDGVWNYVDTWITQNYPNSPEIQSSLRMMAKAMQFEILNYSNKNAIIQEFQNDYSEFCLSKADPQGSDQLMETFQGVVLNTPARTQDYFLANDQMSGTMTGLPSDAAITQYCGF